MALVQTMNRTYLEEDAEEGEQRLAHDGTRRLELRQEDGDEGRGVRQRLHLGDGWTHEE